MNMISLIKGLKKDEINDFVDSRVSELKNKEEKEIGFNTDITVYDGFLDENVRTNVSCEFLVVDGYIENYIGSIVFDDKEMFEGLVNEVIDNDNICIAITKAVNKYLSLDSRYSKYRGIPQYQSMRSEIYHSYSSSMNKPLSIKLFHDNKAAMCAEVAGVTQNMFKFLGIDSDYVVIGEENDDFHAFNIVYPNGRDNKAVLYDFSNRSNGYPLICVLDDEKKEQLLSNKKIKITREEIHQTYHRDINWKHKDIEYSIFKDGNPKTIVESKKPFTIERKLVFKNIYKEEL